MAVFTHPDFAGHERVLFCRDARLGLTAIIALHSTVLGPAAGGCRYRRYASEDEALADVLRLSRGMTYKNAMAELPFGGGKAVILAPEAGKSGPLLERFGDFVESLQGSYVTAEDVGMSLADLRQVSTRTAHVSGLKSSCAGGAGGNPAPWTAAGVFLGIQAAVRRRLHRSSLDGARIAVMGLGAVGTELCARLDAAGAHLIVADVDVNRVADVCTRFGATAVSPEEILRVPADVLAPCALGGILNQRTIPNLHVAVVAGAANNQLASERDGEALLARNILYAPDFVINAGGIISVGCEYLGGYSEQDVARRVAEIGPRLQDLFSRASQAGVSPGRVAVEEAERRVVGAQSNGTEVPQGYCLPVVAQRAHA